MTDLADRLDAEYAEAWRPNPGDKIVGTIATIEMFTGQYEPYPIVTVDTDDGPRSVHAFHTVLRSELAGKKPQPGDRIGIKYRGKSDKGYESYRVVVESDRRVDWDRVGHEADSELQMAELSGKPPRGDYGPDEAPF